MKKILIVALFLVLSGCAHLVIKKENKVATKIAKVFYRFIIVWPTLGISELGIADARDEMLKEEIKQEMDKILLKFYNSVMTNDEFEKAILRFEFLKRKYDSTEERRQRRWEAAAAAFQGAAKGLQNAQRQMQATNEYYRRLNQQSQEQSDRQQIIHELRMIRNSLNR